MIATYLGVVQFYAAITAVSLAFGRALKARFPTMPKRALPAIVVAFAFAAVAVDALAGGATIAAAASFAAVGLLSGAVAVGAHELAKGGLSALLGETLAIAIMGKLAPPAPPPPKPRRARKAGKK